MIASRTVLPLLVLVAASLLHGVRAPAQDTIEARAAAEPARLWLASHAIRLRTVEAGSGFDDMQPFKQVVGNARLVALGEATHGTSEFFQLKHRILEFLVTQMGFTVFGIEGAIPEAGAINEYVLTGKGDPVQALKEIGGWLWDTQEVLGMIQWIRQYNADARHLKKVKFYGFDICCSMPLSLKVTLNFLYRVDVEQAASVEKSLADFTDSLTAQAAQRVYDATAQQRGAWQAVIHGALTRFDERKSEYIEKTSRVEWEVARHHATSVAQNLMMLDPESSSSFRDSAMAENVRWVLAHEGPEARMVVWAHNGHVATERGKMGGYLRKALGPEMVVFGFAFNEGGFQAEERRPREPRLVHPFNVSAAPAGSLDETLAAAGLQIAALDLRDLPTAGAVAGWFADSQQTRSIGKLYPWPPGRVDAVSRQVTPKLYDVLLFVEKTTAARPNKVQIHKSPEQERR